MTTSTQHTRPRSLQRGLTRLAGASTFCLGLAGYSATAEASALPMTEIRPALGLGTSAHALATHWTLNAGAGLPAPAVVLPNAKLAAQLAAPPVTALTLVETDTQAAPATDDDDDKSSGKGKKPKFQHGIGVGFTVSAIPHKLFSTFLARYSTASCRKEIPQSFRDDGVLRDDGCNWGIDLMYTYRHTKHFEINVDLGYRKLELPDGYWLLNEDWGPGCTIHGFSEDCDLGDAHYTEVDLDHLALGIDFVGRATVLKVPNFELQIGGGGGVRTLFFVGDGIYKTPLGMRPSPEGPNSSDEFNGRFPGSPSGRGCYEADHLGDFTRCTPHWIDIDSVDQDGDGLPTPDTPIPDELTKGEGLFAQCDENGCDEADLQALGTRQRGTLPKVLPLIRILVSVRMIAADHYALVLDGGWDSGFFFRSALQYHF